MLSEKEIRALYAQGEDGVVAVVLAMQQQVAVLTARVAELERQRKKNSRNSSKPPSSDGYGKPRSEKRREQKRRGRKPGGQPGHQGRTLEMVAEPDLREQLWPQRCKDCGRRLSRAGAEIGARAQVFEIPPPRLEVTEYQVMVCQCRRCGAANRADLPEGVVAGAQYGRRMKAVQGYLQVMNLLPLERTSRLLSDLFGAGAGQGTLVATVREGASRVRPVLEQIRQGITAAPVAHFDETGMRVAGRLQWLHTAGTEKLTYYQVDPKRGRAAMDRIGILPEYRGTAVHDGCRSYWGYVDCAHALCNAHHLRELEAILESTDQRWAEEMGSLLRQAQRWKVAGRLTPTRLRLLPIRYDEILERGQIENFYDLREAVATMENGKLKRSPAQKLVDRLMRDKAAVLRFVTDPAVPFDNNLAERDVRMMKVKQKVSGCFRTETGADDFLALRAYISTMWKQGVDVLEALTALSSGQPIMPALA